MKKRNFNNVRVFPSLLIELESWDIKFWILLELHIKYILFSSWNKDISLTRTSIVVLRVSVLEKFHCSLASQTHFCNKREGSGELCIQAISAVLYSVVQSCCTSLAHDTLQRFSCNNSLDNNDKDPRHHFHYCRSSGRFKGDKGGSNAPPLVASNVFLRTYLHESIKWFIQQWHAATTTRHSYTLSSLLISRRLSRPRVASRYSVQTSSYFTS